MSEGFHVDWSIALIVAGIMILFVVGSLFMKIGERGVRPGAEASALAFSYGILFLALCLIGIGIYLRTRKTQS